VPLGHRSAGAGELALSGAAAPKQIATAAALGLLRPLLEDPAKRKIGHNLKFDLVVLAEAFARHMPKAPPLAPVALDDTMLASFVLDAGRGEHGLKDLAASVLNARMTSFAEATGGGKTPFAEVPVAQARDYAAADADMTLRLWRVLSRRLVTEHMVGVYETIERPLIGPIVEMERAGIRVDPSVLRKLSQRFGERMAELELEAHKHAGRPFNLGSPKQLGEVLFAQLGLAPGRKGKSGAFSTSADVLEDLAAQGQPLPRTVLAWRLLAKLKSTYADTLVEEVNPATGRVHTAFGMTGAQTGRLSSNDPNLQNIPIRSEEGREIRNAFIAAPGYLLVSLDYSQIELRIVAHVAEETALIEAFRQGQDIHALTAAQVFGVPLKDIDASYRRRAKAINFGIIYGISPFGLARNLGIERAEAKAYIDAYFQRYPGIRIYMDRSIAFARAHGFVRTIFGRKVHLAGIGDKNPSVRGFAERQAINAPIQGAAADIIKRAMARARPALDAAGLQARMLLQVHDELLFEAPEAEVEATIAAMRNVMETAPLPAVRLKVPLVADAGSGRHWGAAH
jgi:DNA polymerase I